jgi:hypothetical protein
MKEAALRVLLIRYISAFVKFQQLIYFYAINHNALCQLYRGRETLELTSAGSHILLDEIKRIHYNNGIIKNVS